MSKLLFVILFHVGLYATSVDMWQYTHSFLLTKDEVAKIILKKHEEDKIYDKEGELVFRWTLHHNNMLTLLLEYEAFPRQYTLRKEYKRDSVRIYLNDDHKKEFDRAYAVFRFAKFEKGTATIDVQVHDPFNSMIKVDFIDPKRDKGKNVK